mgnify:CR=1 FL=1
MSAGRTPTQPELFFPAGAAYRHEAMQYLEKQKDLSEIQTAKKLAVLPGFCDVHVHLREPGFSYKETIKTGTLAAKAGGFTDVCSMPNLDPVPDSVAHLEKQLDIIRRDAAVRVHPYAAITVGEKGETLSDMEDLAPYVVAFSDDGCGVQSEELMENAMRHAKRLGKILVAHCEDNSLLHGGYIHAGIYAAAHGHAGICSESEWRPIERDLALAAKTGASYHVCHISCAESVNLIRQAKKAGIDVTCETAPHYLLLSENDLKEDGRFKMNPPLRSERDKDALLKGLCDGVIDMIATDHAPHSEEEKHKGLKDSRMGVVGLETAFSVLYTGLVKKGVLPLEKLIQLMSSSPRKRFGIAEPANEFCLWDLEKTYTVTPEKFQSMGRATPFEGMMVSGKLIYNSVNSINNHITEEA